MLNLKQAKRFLSALSYSLVIVLATLSSAQATSSGSTKQNIVIKLDEFTKSAAGWRQSEDEWYPVCMALGLGNNLLGTKQNPKVTLFLNLSGVYLADGAEPLDNKYCNKDKSLEQLWNGFQAAGGQIMVCPGCAKTAGLAEANLREGAKMGDHESVGKLFLKANKVIDY
jgi:predicted peroxiredoxin